MTEGTVAGEQLRSFVERIENLEADKKVVTDDIKELYSAAKQNGFDPKTIRKVIAYRKQKKADREEQQMLLDTYLHALGELADTPLGSAAVRREFETAA